MLRGARTVSKRRPTKIGSPSTRVILPEETKKDHAITLQFWQDLPTTEDSPKLGIQEANSSDARTIFWRVLGHQDQHYARILPMPVGCHPTASNCRNSAHVLGEIFSCLSTMVIQLHGSISPSPSWLWVPELMSVLVTLFTCPYWRPSNLS